MTILYHITDSKNLDGILAEGLRANSYWTDSLDLSDYYAETVRDEGGIPITLSIELDNLNLDAASLEPDYPGIEEPITTVIGMSEDEVLEAWGKSDQTWQDSLSIIGSLRCRQAITHDVLVAITEDDETLRLDEFIQRRASPSRGRTP